MLNVFMKVAFIFLIMLLIVNVFAYVLFETSDHVITFSEFLDRIDNAPQIELELSESVEIFTITDDWGAFNFAKVIINALGSVLGLLVWIGALLINLVSIIGYLLYLFGVASFSSFI